MGIVALARLKYEDYNSVITIAFFTNCSTTIVLWQKTRNVCNIAGKNSEISGNALFL